MKTKGISSSAYSIIDDCLTAECNKLMEELRQVQDIAEAMKKSELLGKLKAARSEFIQVHLTWVSYNESWLFGLN